MTVASSSSLSARRALASHGIHAAARLGVSPWVTGNALGSAPRSPSVTPESAASQRDRPERSAAPRDYRTTPWSQGLRTSSAVAGRQFCSDGSPQVSAAVPCKRPERSASPQGCRHARRSGPRRSNVAAARRFGSDASPQSRTRRQSGMTLARCLVSLRRRTRPARRTGRSEPGRSRASTASGSRAPRTWKNSSGSNAATK
mmetsp:Transcript_8430/g.21616  ORF Transcript_8430/g.21616 Transcript_8430/m.21616 type:complete len:201 (+) Transcript_8430:961-1563(+)